MVCRILFRYDIFVLIVLNEREIMYNMTYFLLAFIALVRSVQKHFSRKFEHLKKRYFDIVKWFQKDRHKQKMTPRASRCRCLFKKMIISGVQNNNCDKSHGILMNYDKHMLLFCLKNLIFTSHFHYEKPIFKKVILMLLIERPCLSNHAPNLSKGRLKAKISQSFSALKKIACSRAQSSDRCFERRSRSCSRSCSRSVTKERG